MNKYMHVFNTWVLANVFHPLILLVIAGVIGNGVSLFDFFYGADFSFLFSVWFYFFLLSTPCLFVSWLVFGLIVNSPFGWISKFAIWIAVSAMIILLEFLIITQVIHFTEIDTELLGVLAAPILSAWIAIAIRLAQFKRICGKGEQVANNKLNL